MKLNLNFALYKGKTRLREWWKQVKAHFIEVQDAINELDTDISNEATTRDRVDTAIMQNLTDEISERAAADSRLQSAIDAEETARKAADERLRSTMLACYDFGSYYVYDNTTTYDVTFYDCDFKTGSIVQFTIADRDTGMVRLPTGGILLSGEPASFVIEYPFKKGHTYQAIMKISMNEAEVITDNGVFVNIAAEKLARESADSELQASIDTLNAGDTVPGSVAKAIKDSINAFASALTDDGTINTYAEALNWIQTHGAECTTLLGQVTANMTNIKELQGVSHAHDNKDVIDYITAEDIERLRTFKSQVTQEQLEEALADEAAEREKGNPENASLFDYLEDVAFGHEREFHLLYLALGIGHYNGSLFGTPYDDDNLDGGDFDNEPENTIDFGDFEPIIISVPSGDAVDVIDGGTY